VHDQGQNAAGDDRGGIQQVDLALHHAIVDFFQDGRHHYDTKGHGGAFRHEVSGQQGAGQEMHELDDMGSQEATDASEPNHEYADSFCAIRLVVRPGVCKQR